MVQERETHSMRFVRLLLVCLTLTQATTPPALAEAPEPYQKTTDEVLRLLLANEPQDAVEVFFSKSPFRERITDTVVTMKARLSKFETQVGLPTKHVKLAEEKVGGMFAH